MNQSNFNIRFSVTVHQVKLTIPWQFQVRRKDKKPYPADTLMQIASGLQRYLRQVSCRSEVNFFDKYSNTFAEFREALKCRSGELNLENHCNRGGWPHGGGLLRQCFQKYLDSRFTFRGGGIYLLVEILEKTYIFKTHFIIDVRFKNALQKNAADRSHFD